MTNFEEDFIYSVEELKDIKKYYEMEYHRTNNSKFQNNLDEIENYLNEYNKILENIENSTELKLYKYLNLVYRHQRLLKKLLQKII